MEIISDPPTYICFYALRTILQMCMMCCLWHRENKFTQDIHYENIVCALNFCNTIILSFSPIFHKFYEVPQIISSSELSASHMGTGLSRVVTIPIQSLANMPGKTAEEDPNSLTSALRWETWLEFQSLDFRLAQSGLLQSFGERSSRWMYSLCLLINKSFFKQTIYICLCKSNGANST